MRILVLLTIANSHSQSHDTETGNHVLWGVGDPSSHNTATISIKGGSENANYRNGMARRQGLYWIGTISCAQGWEPQLPAGVKYIKGQKEEGEGGFLHFQLFFITERKTSQAAVCAIFAPVVGHWELTRSSAAESYVWKEDTRIGEQFEYGRRSVRRNSAHDWDEIKEKALQGNLCEIPSDVFIRYYRTLQAIAADHSSPVAIERSCKTFWGVTGSGKSRRAWEIGGNTAYPKDPRSKFWCGYKDQKVVIIDEFRGGIDISHLLRWLDRYPINVEIKGSSRPLVAELFIITSNIHPNEWYPTLDAATLSALIRRMEIIEMN